MIEKEMGKRDGWWRGRRKKMKEKEREEGKGRGRKVE